MSNQSLSPVIPTEFVRSPCRECKVQQTLEFYQDSMEHPDSAQSDLRDARCTPCKERVSYSRKINTFVYSNTEQPWDNVESLHQIVTHILGEMGLTLHDMRKLNLEEFQLLQIKFMGDEDFRRLVYNLKEHHQCFTTNYYSETPVWARKYD